MTFWKYFFVAAEVEEDIEIGKRCLNKLDALASKIDDVTTVHLVNPHSHHQEDYDYWHNITERLTYFQGLKLPTFWQSSPLIKTAKTENRKICIKLEKNSIKFGAKECRFKDSSKEGLPEIQKFLAKCLQEQTSHVISLEQKLAYFPKYWLPLWSVIFEELTFISVNVTTLKMKNLHISNSDFLKFLLSSNIRNLTLENITFETPISIGEDLFEQYPKLETITVSQCPLARCDKAAFKYASKQSLEKAEYFYNRLGSNRRNSNRSELPYANFDVPMFWLIKFFPYFYSIFCYFSLFLVYNLSKSNFNFILAAIFGPLIILGMISWSLKMLIFQQKVTFFPRLACYVYLRLKLMQSLPCFFTWILYFIVLILIVAFYGTTFVNLCLSKEITEQALLQLRIPLMTSISYFLLNLVVFCWINGFVKK